MKIVTYNIQFGLGKDGHFDLERVAAEVDGADIMHCRKSNAIGNVAVTSINRRESEKSWIDTIGHTARISMSMRAGLGPTAGSRTVAGSSAI